MSWEKNILSARKQMMANIAQYLNTTEKAALAAPSGEQGVRLSVFDGAVATALVRDAYDRIAVRVRSDSGANDVPIGLLSLEDLAAVFDAAKRARKMEKKKKKKDVADDNEGPLAALVAYASILGVGRLRNARKHPFVAVTVLRTLDGAPVDCEPWKKILLPSDVVRPATEADLLRFGLDKGVFTEAGVDVAAKKDHREVRDVPNWKLEHVIRGYGAFLGTQARAVNIALGDAPGGDREVIGLALEKGGAARRILVRWIVLGHYLGDRVEVQNGRYAIVGAGMLDSLYDKIRLVL